MGDALSRPEKAICEKCSARQGTAMNSLRNGGPGKNSLSTLLESLDGKFGDRSRDDSGQARVVMDESLWSELPAHVLERVLAFLPATSLLRHRGVCKDWNKALQSKSFLELYSEVTIEQPWFLMFQTGPCNKVAAYNPSLGGWHQISLSFIPTDVLCVAAGGSILVCQGERDGPLSLYVCNPITKSWKKLPPMIKKRVVPIISVVIEKERNSYKITVVGDDLHDDGFNVQDLTSEVYDSYTNSWRMLGSIPDQVDLDLGSTYCNGFLYFVAYYPYGVLSLDVREGVWRHVKAAIPRHLTIPSLVECQGKLLMVGGIEKEDALESILMWELRENGTRWEEIVKMPSETLRDFFKTPTKVLSSNDRYFSSVGHGNLVCLTLYESVKVLAYDMEQKCWSQLPNYPSKENSDEKHLWGFSFDPRIDITV